MTTRQLEPNRPLGPFIGTMTQSTQIKICGITTREVLDAAAKSGAHYAGFVHFAKSPRHLSLEAIASLSADMPGDLKPVVLLVDPDDHLVIDTCRIVAPHAIQLHGEEKPEAIAAWKTLVECDFWKALPLRSDHALVRAERYAKQVDLLLFDTPAPDTSDLPGGNGKPADWSLLSRFRPETPWGLAGGLTPDNVRDAIAQTGAPLVDVSSGVESEPGVKDMDKIARFCQAVRRS